MFSPYANTRLRRSACRYVQHSCQDRLLALPARELLFDLREMPRPALGCVNLAVVSRVTGALADKEEAMLASVPVSILAVPVVAGVSECVLDYLQYCNCLRSIYIFSYQWCHAQRAPAC